jgi:hypothetical protein
MSRPHRSSGQVWAISFVSYEGLPPRGENFWQASHERTIRFGCTNNVWPVEALTLAARALWPE